MSTGAVLLGPAREEDEVRAELTLLWLEGPQVDPSLARSFMATMMKESQLLPVLMGMPGVSPPPSAPRQIAVSPMPGDVLDAWPLAFEAGTGRRLEDRFLDHRERKRIAQAELRNIERWRQ